MARQYLFLTNRKIGYDWLMSLMNGSIFRILSSRGHFGYLGGQHFQQRSTCFDIFMVNALKKWSRTQSAQVQRATKKMTVPPAHPSVRCVANNNSQIWESLLSPLKRSTPKNVHRAPHAPYDENDAVFLHDEHVKLQRTCVNFSTMMLTYHYSILILPFANSCSIGSVVGETWL